jgi:hypothetical protein
MTGRRGQAWQLATETWSETHRVRLPTRISTCVGEDVRASAESERIRFEISPRRRDIRPEKAVLSQAASYP